MKDNAKSNVKGLLIVFVVGVLLVSYFVIKMMNAAPVAPPDDVMVLVTTKDLEQGDVISVPEMQWKQFSPDKIKPEHTKKSQHELIRALEGAIVRSPIMKGEAIDDNDLIKTGSKSALSTVVRHGMRAVPVPYTKISNPPTLISPGDVVDIIIPRAIPGQKQVGNDVTYEAQTILKGIRILAVDTALEKMDKNDSKSSSSATTSNMTHTITLEVNAAQAELLAESIRQGQIVLSMHSVFAGEDDQLSQPQNPLPQIMVNQEPEVKITKKDKIVKVVRGSDKKDEIK